jgi:hypothetical protein
MTLALSGGSIRQIYNGASKISMCLFLDQKSYNFFFKKKTISQSAMSAQKT